MQPLYFLPGVTRGTLLPGGELSRSLLESRGLANVFADVTTADAVVNELTGPGPGKQTGLVLTYRDADGQVDGRMGYYAAQQEWQSFLDGKLWIGIDTANPPTPEQLRRKRQHRGYPIELADGDQWQIPIIRRPDGSSLLPTDMYVDDAGELQQPLKRQYLTYWEESAEVADWFFSENGSGSFGGESFSAKKALSLAVRALSLNYRFGDREQAVLRILDSETYIAVLGFSVDVVRFRAIAEAQKKTEPPSGTETITPGQTAN